jgi:hypothetical protein
MSELRNLIIPENGKNEHAQPLSDETGRIAFEDSPYIDHERGGPQEMRTDTRKKVLRGAIIFLLLVLAVELVLVYQLGWRLQPPPPQIPPSLLIQPAEPTTVWMVEPPQPTETPYPVIEETPPAEPPPLNEFIEPPTLEPG